ncbi:amino acid adenylation domain-containing protein [Paenibacillus chartarius]|uniref:Amino acid adenylation domain-containing protein n=1 Tax=Paenibacillus chartarius TaxID=747481 RepID=A0ABV6DTF5_9BACL
MSSFKKEHVKDMYYLSPMQEGMLFHTLLHPGGAYFEQMTVRIRGELDIALFEQSMNRIIERYDVFRTTFLYEKIKRPVQVVLKQRSLQIEVVDVTGLPADEQLARLETFKRKDRETGFDLSRDIPTRMIVFKLGAGEYEMIWSHHHILMDGWCLGIIINELFKIYGHLKRGETPALPPVQPYSTYIQWLEKQNKEEALGYWRELLGDYEQAASLPKRAAPGGLYKQAELKFSFGVDLSRRLQELASKCQVTLNTLFQTLWGVLLQRYNHTDDIVFGSVVSGRPSELPGIETMVGLFINTIPVRIRSAGTETFSELTAAVQRLAVASERFDYMPLYEIQNVTPLKQDLLNHIVVFENYPIEKEVAESGSEDVLGFDASDVSMFEQTSYDMNILVLPSEDVTVKFNFNAAVYDPAMLETLGGHLRMLAEQAVADPGIAVSAMRLITGHEEELLARFNDTAADYPADQTVHGWFEEQAGRTPDAVAVVFGGQRVTYGQLNDNANRLAHALIRHGVAPDQPVGIMADRSIEYVTGVLAVLKAGGAFVPIDPDYPEDRASYMLDNSGAKLLLTQLQLVGKASTIAGKERELLLLQPELYAAESARNPNAGAASGSLLYVIYTSGTTGRPKGVMLEHKNLVNLLAFEFQKTNVSYNGKVLQYTTISFDVCYQEIFSTLLSGGTLHLIDNDTKRSVEKLTAYVTQEEIPVLFLPVSFLKFVFNEQEYVDMFPSCVRHIITAGEQLVVPNRLRTYLRERGVTLHNHYGPSETHVVTTLTMSSEEDIAELPTIGRPISNTSIHIVSNGLQLQPVGIVGELYIAGDSVGRGYIGNDELTAEKFTESPFRTGERMYRTGDLARWLPDGEIEFLGRIDHQVKIRGHRIELGEIESRLLNHASVTEAAVLAYDDGKGGKYLCAYVAAAEQLTAAELREHVLAALPDYMVPSYFIQLPKLPLTPNGKTDRRALPLPEGGPNGGEAFVEPRNELERTLAAIWSDVLGVERVGIRDNFFTLGGHSLKAMMLVSRMNKQCETDVPLKVLFERPTIEALSAYMSGSDAEASAAPSSIPRAPVQQFYPVSSAQKRMFVLSQLSGVHTGYNIPGVFILEGELDLNRFQSAMEKLVDRHESLRTSFEVVNGEPVQRVHDKVPFSVTVVEATGLQVEPEALAERFIRPFDLTSAPLFRAELVKLAGNRHLFMFDMHHIVADGVSLSIIIGEFTALYRGEVLPQLRIQYKDYAVWQNGTLSSDELSKKEAYWLERFGGEVPLLDLPTDLPRPAVRSFAGHHQSLQLTPELSGQLERLAAKEGATLYMVLLAAYYGLLYKYTGQTDIIVGTPVAGRTHADLEPVVGMFVNTVALRAAPEGGKTFRQLLAEVKQEALQAFDYQDYPYETLLEKLNIPRDLSRNPLFDVLFMVQNMTPAGGEPDGLELTPCTFGNPVSKFDLTMLAEPSETGITLGVEYCTALFREQTIERMLRHFAELLDAIVSAPDAPLAEIAILTESERRELLVSFNAIGAEFSANRSIPQLFDEQAARTPEALAVRMDDRRLSYGELQSESAQLAAVLRRAGVGAETIVGVIMERSVEMVVTILAILKAGGAYVPIDIDYPQERIRYIVQDSGAKLIVTRERERDQVAGLVGDGPQLIAYESVTAHAAADAEDTPLPAVRPTDLAYVIYTSGTTGMPKGTMLEHTGIANLQMYFREHYGIGPGDRIAQFASSSFDASVWEMFMALLTGASLHLVPKDALNDYVSFEAFMNREEITVATLPPTFAVHLEPERLPHVRRLITAGSATTRELVGRWLGRAAYVNAYGPTETTICATACEVTEQLLESPGSVPIGGPLPNTSVYIVNRDGQLQPVGVPGELCVGGVGLARGYLHRPELTAEKFVANPFVSGERMYRTGDLARWLPDGHIEYMGRIDHQVKIRGYRIELGEIEASMLKHPELTEAIAIAHRDERGDAYLCAYYTAETALDAADLREHLSALLPSFMLPSHLIRLERMPLTSNGKIDRTALKKPAELGLDGSAAYEEPRTPTERTLAEMWSELLGVPQVGRNDDFFRLGGHSLKAMSLVAKVVQSFGVKLELSALFERTTLAALASAIDGGDREPLPAIEPLPLQPHYEVSPAQRRMFIMHQYESGGTGYNMPGAMVVEGELDPDRLEDAFRAIIKRHEAFRTTFTTVGGEPVQVIHDDVPFEMAFRDAGGRDIDTLLREFVQPFELEQAPLLRVGLIALDRSRHLLLIDMHHIVSDGVTMSVLIGELAELYAGRELPELKVQYKDFAAWQNRLFASPAFERMEAFWSGQFAGGAPQLALPTDFPRPNKRSFQGDSITFHAGAELRRQLHRVREETGATLFMLLLAAYNVLLAKYAGQDDIVVGTPAAGRPHAELEGVVGMFVNTLALRNYPRAELTFADFVADLKARTLAAFEHQDYPLEQLVAKLELHRDLSRNPLFDTVFSMQNIQGRNDSDDLLNGLSFTPYEAGSTIAKFDLTLSAIEEDEGIRFCFEYATSLFRRDTADRLATDLLKVLEAVANDPNVRIADIVLIEAGQLDNVLGDNVQFHF